MEKLRGDLVVLNGQVIGKEEYKSPPGAELIYEVIRVIEGRFLFLDDHLLRLQISCLKSGLHFPGNDVLKEPLHNLMEAASIRNGNIKINLWMDESEVFTACFFVPHFYPELNDYSNGVATLTYRFERPDPTIKRWNDSFRTDVNDFIRRNGIYEALLVNQQNLLTEGSRSNLFFIDQENSIVTSPEHMILPGITRRYVLDLARNSGLKIDERAMPVPEAGLMKSCFLSGTSPKVLPVNRIDDLQFDSKHPVLKDLMMGFDKLLM